jgi:hypothetical protein
MAHTVSDVIPFVVEHDEKRAEVRTTLVDGEPWFVPGTGGRGAGPGPPTPTAAFSCTPRKAPGTTACQPARYCASTGKLNQSQYRAPL